MTKIGEFRSAVEEHVREEEDKIFPKLKAKLSAEQNKALTAAMNKEGFKLA
jgi:hemerythrin superfamily protein